MSAAITWFSGWSETRSKYVNSDTTFSMSAHHCRLLLLCQVWICWIPVRWLTWPLQKIPLLCLKKKKKNLFGSKMSTVLWKLHSQVCFLPTSCYLSPHYLDALRLMTISSSSRASRLLLLISFPLQGFSKVSSCCYVTDETCRTTQCLLKGSIAQPFSGFWGVLRAASPQV